MLNLFILDRLLRGCIGLLCLPNPVVKRAEVVLLRDSSQLYLVLKERPLDFVVVGNRQMPLETVLLEDGVSVNASPVMPTEAHECLYVVFPRRNWQVLLSHKGTEAMRLAARTAVFHLENRVNRVVQVL